MDAVATIETKDEGKTYSIPESRIGSARDAQQTITTLREAEIVRSRRRAKFNGMLNGNPPWPALLRMKGQGERANFTLREAEGFMASAKTPYYALAFKADRFIQLTLEYGAADPATVGEWERKIATRYQYANEDDDTLDTHMQRSQFQMIAHGSGPMVWEDDYDWKATSRMAGQLLLPTDSSADIDDWETVGCERSYLPSKLWKIIKDEGKAAALGWNVPETKRAIMEASPEDLRKRFATGWEYYEAEIRKGATGFDSKSKRIFVADLYQKEFTGRISQFIVVCQEGQKPVLDSSSENDATDSKTGFLFRKIGKYDSFSRIICPFLYDVGPDGQWHSVKGAGPKVFDFYSASDRLTCRALDGAMKASGVIVRAKDAKALSEAAFTDVAGGTVIGPDYEVEQQRIAPNLEGPLSMKRDLQLTLQSNTGQYKQRVSEENQEPTLGQAQLNVQQQAVLGDHDASRYVKQLDRFVRERFRRILAMGEKLYRSRKGLAPSKNERVLTPSEEGALKFYRGCVEKDGVPPQVLKFENFCRIRAGRLPGNGDSMTRMMISEKLLGLLPMVDERGRNFILRSNVSGLAGETWADAIVPPYSTPQVVDSNVSVATMENNFLKLPNAEVAVDPQQDHVTHFGIHEQSVGQHAQQVQAGQDDPHNLLLHLEQAGPHMAEHISKIAGDPTRKQQVKAMQDSWETMSKTADQLKQQLDAADQAAAANQPAQQADPALIAALAKVTGDLQIKQQKMQGDMALKSQKQTFTLRQKDIETAHKIRLTNLEALTKTNGAAA